MSEYESFPKSKFFTFFTSGKQGEEDIFKFSELFNSRLISGGMNLNKIGRFDPCEFQNNNISNKNLKTLEGSSNKKSHNSISEFEIKPGNLIDNSSFLSLNKEYTQNPIRTSLVSSSFSSRKIKKFVTTNNKHKIHSMFDVDAGKENKFKVEANKMTRRLIEENILNITQNNTNQAESNSIYVDDIKRSSIKFEYLFEKFKYKFEEDESFQFYNVPLLSLYKEQKGVPSINFGENPLDTFKGYLTWLNSEQKKAKEAQPNQFSLDLVNTLNEISANMSSLPIFMYPNDQNDSILISSMSKKKKSELFEPNEEKKFCCEFCSETFSSGQGLGGHMSRKHKDQSIKFKHKREIRNKREPFRNILLQARKLLCKNHLLDFEEHSKTKNGKKLIKKLIIDYNEEYKKIRNELKRNYPIVEK